MTIGQLRNGRMIVDEFLVNGEFTKVNVWMYKDGLEEMEISESEFNELVRQGWKIKDHV